MRKLSAVFLLGLVVLASACASTVKAKVPVERPNLDVPPPPPRVIEPAPVPEAPPDPVPDLPPPPAPTKPRPSPPRPQPAEVKVEPKPETPPETTPAPPPPQLRTPQTADGTEVERTVRATLERAKNLLGTVNYNQLSNERKKAYNDAKAFIQQAEDALKQSNYVFAQSLSTKAETLAIELAGR